MQNILEFTFGNQVVEFDITGADVLVNATEMALIYGKEDENIVRIQEYSLIESKLRQIANRIGKYNTNQMDLFRTERA